MTRSSSKIEGWTSRHCDGTAGIELYLAPWAFTWSGRAVDPIEVAYGGYGEAVVQLIDLSWGHGQLDGWTLARTLEWFTQVCEEFETWSSSEDATDAQVLEFDVATSASRQHFIDTGVYLLAPATISTVRRYLGEDATV